MRVIVKPSHPEARIPDLDRGGRYLPPAGQECELTPYWLGLEKSGDVVLEEIEAEAPAPTPAPAASPVKRAAETAKDE